MELNLQLVLNGGVAQFFARCDSLDELDAVKNYLKEQGILPPAPGVPATAGNGQQTAPQEGQQPGEAEKPKRGRPAKNAAAPSTDATTASTANAGGAAAGGAPNTTASTAPATATAKAVTIEDVTAAITKLANDKRFGLPEALATNQRFGVKKAGELKPEQYADYVAFVEKCLSTGTKPSESHANEEPDISSLV